MYSKTCIEFCILYIYIYIFAYIYRTESLPSLLPLPPSKRVLWLAAGVSIVWIFSLLEFRLLAKLQVLHNTGHLDLATAFWQSGLSLHHVSSWHWCSVIKVSKVIQILNHDIISYSKTRKYDFMIHKISYLAIDIHQRTDVWSIPGAKAKNIFEWDNFDSKQFIVMLIVSEYNPNSIA